MGRVALADSLRTRQAPSRARGLFRRFNRSRIRTVLAAVLTTNLRLANAPGNVLPAAEEAGLPRDSVVNVSQVITVDKSERTGKVGFRVLLAVEDGLRTVLAL